MAAELETGWEMNDCPSGTGAIPNLSAFKRNWCNPQPVGLQEELVQSPTCRPSRGTGAIPNLSAFKRTDAYRKGCSIRARLMVNGQRQVPGVDFEEVRGSFAPGSEHATLIALLSKVPAQDMELH